MKTFLFLVSASVLSSTFWASFAGAQTPVLVPTYNSIKELVFTAKCLKCHNSTDPSASAKDMPFDTYAAMLANVDDDGKKIVVPGDTQASILNKILIKSPAVMPPKKSGIPPVTPEELAIVQLWIQKGAPEN
jgi:hypothetical protein